MTSANAKMRLEGTEQALDIIRSRLEDVLEVDIRATKYRLDRHSGHEFIHQYLHVTTKNQK